MHPRLAERSRRCLRVILVGESLLSGLICVLSKRWGEWCELAGAPQKELREKQGSWENGNCPGGKPLADNQVYGLRLLTSSLSQFNDL